MLLLSCRMTTVDSCDWENLEFSVRGHFATHEWLNAVLIGTLGYASPLLLKGRSVVHMVECEIPCV